MIKNIIFDIGGVLVRHDPKDILDKMDIPKERKEHLLELFRTDRFFNDVDLGLYEGMLKALPSFQERHPEAKDDLQAFFDLGFLDSYTPLIKGQELLKRFQKEGYHIYLLSNFSKDGIDILKKKFDFFSYVDGELISYRVRVIKPDVRIYRLLLEKFDLMAEECLFLDDRKDNVEVSKKLGFHAIVFDENTIDSQLKEYLD